MNTNKIESLWDRCLSYIKNQIDDQAFDTWFKPIKAIQLEEHVLTIQVPSQFFYEWLEQHYINLLHKVIKRELGSNGRLEYSIVVEKSSSSKNPYTINLPTGGKRSTNSQINLPTDARSIKNPFVIPGIKKIRIESQLNPERSFDTFIEGDCNRLARSAGWAVATKPGATSFNPLVLYGGVGLGKTHLAQAIGNGVKANFPEKTVLYVSSEKFTNQFIDALRNNSLNDFVNFYQLVDVLVMDDIQFFAKKDKTQDVFFHIFNHIHQANKQLILTSDCAPKDLEGIEERLISRFKWGLVADLQKPNVETRIAILRAKMYKDGIELPDDVVEFIAHNIQTNVRELEGALISIMAHSFLSKTDPDLSLAKDVLKNLVKNVVQEINIESIQHLVSDFYGLVTEDLKSKTRKREIVQARQIAMFFSKKFTKSSLKLIGTHFGGRDHSTVIHSCQTVTDLKETDRKYRKDIEEIEKKIKMSAL